MPLTEEQKKAAREKVAWLMTVYQNHCAYRYSQAEELKKTWKYRDSQGVCFAMSLDWLRRKMFNLNNPGLKQKHELNDPQYNSKSKRVHLTKKHGKLQDAYLTNKKATRVGRATTDGHITAMVAANVVNSGLDHLTVGACDHVPAYQLDESPRARNAGLGTANAHLTFAQKLKDFVERAEGVLAANPDPAVGILFHMQGGNGGHATAFLLDTGQIRFFDPNVGEFFFDRNTERRLAVQFVSLLWFDLYHTYRQFDTLEFELIRYA